MTLDTTGTTLYLDEVGFIKQKTGYNILNITNNTNINTGQKCGKN